MDFSMSVAERALLRDLARRQRELSESPGNALLERRWYAHNEVAGPDSSGSGGSSGSGTADSPMVLMETKYCEDDLIDLECESAFAREIELGLKRHIVNHDLVGDDKVVPGCHSIQWDASVRTLDLDMEEKRVMDSRGKSVGYTTIQHLRDLPNSMGKIGRTVRRVDKAHTLRRKEAVEEVLDGILPVRIVNDGGLNWAVSPSKKAEYLMGLEAMMLAPYDCPDEFRALYRILVDDILETLAWMSAEGILELNNGNDYAGAGSYGFTRQLPTEACRRTGVVTTRDLWGNLNSQETVGVSPEMYGEFYWPYYLELASHFGQVYYGCCEPVNPIWDGYISTLPNLRKVSVSPWADERFMGERLRGTDIIYCRKPSPNYLALDMPFDEEAYRAHIAASVDAAAGCRLEISCRDIYALHGNREKLGRAVRIIREVCMERFRP